MSPRYKAKNKRGKGIYNLPFPSEMTMRALLKEARQMPTKRRSQTNGFHHVNPFPDEEMHPEKYAQQRESQTENERSGSKVSP